MYSLQRSGNADLLSILTGASTQWTPYWRFTSGYKATASSGSANYRNRLTGEISDYKAIALINRSNLFTRANLLSQLEIFPARE